MNEWMKIYKWRVTIFTQNYVCAQWQVPPQANTTITLGQSNPQKLTPKTSDQTHRHTYRYIHGTTVFKHFTSHPSNRVTSRWTTPFSITITKHFYINMVNINSPSGRPFQNFGGGVGMVTVVILGYGLGGGGEGGAFFKISWLWSIVNRFGWHKTGDSDNEEWRVRTVTYD